VSSEPIIDDNTSVLLDGQEGSAQEKDKVMGLPASVNATAYRIFKILVWLNECALSVDELNERFMADPAIGKILSNDSIWLYINTLKALGCEIRRPMRSNQFQYELTYHPFGIHLDFHHLDLLVEIKALLEMQNQREKILAFDQFLKKMISRSAMADRNEFLSVLFQKSRSVDYEGQGTLIQQFRQAIEQQELLILLYRSPMKDKESIYFLPDDLLYQNGALYVLGYQYGRVEGSMLRIDRVENLEVTTKSDILKKLLHQRQQEQFVHIRFFNVNTEMVPAFGLNETLSPVMAINPEYPEQEIPAVDVTLQTRHFFFVRQKILESGLMFSILCPLDFSASVVASLQQMRQLYEFDSEGDVVCKTT
jgi:predicted DNA-binding transcriptional regulator YafY